jgi:hypothetical protein
MNAHQRRKLRRAVARGWLAEAARLGWDPEWPPPPVPTVDLALAQRRVERVERRCRARWLTFARRLIRCPRCHGHGVEHADYACQMCGGDGLLVRQPTRRQRCRRFHPPHRLPPPHRAHPDGWREPTVIECRYHDLACGPDPDGVLW